MVEKNLSRLETQWTESINAALMQIQREAERRLGELIATVTRLIDSSADEAPQIRADLARLGSARDEMQEATSRKVVS
jgi:ABC-type transporter Mla subunit MlaD